MRGTHFLIKSTRGAAPPGAAFAGSAWQSTGLVFTTELGGWIDPNNFNPGYLMRAMHLLPQRGDKPEWQHTQDYWTEKVAIPAIDLDGKEFIYR